MFTNTLSSHYLDNLYELLVTVRIIYSLTYPLRRHPITTGLGSPMSMKWVGYGPRNH